GAHRLTPLIAWQARLVCWLSGNYAARRFLAAAAQLLEDYPQDLRCHQVRGFQQVVMSWKQRGGQERVRVLLKEMALHHKTLAPEIVRRIGCSTRLRGRTYPQHCDRLIDGCTRLIREDEGHRWHLVPAALAALAACDGSPALLPRRYLQPAAAREDYSCLLRMVEKLAEQIGLPGYEALLAALRQMPEPLRIVEPGLLREYLSKGNSLANCVWAAERNLLQVLSHSRLRIADAQRLENAFAGRGFPLDGYELGAVVSRIQHKEHLAAIYAWLAWLGGVSPRAITPRLRDLLWSSLWNRLLTSVGQQGWFEQLAPCLVPPRRAAGRAGQQPLLDTIAEYQRMARKKMSLPKSLRKLLGSQISRQRERDRLRTLLAAGEIGPAAQARLRHLENEAGRPPSAAKLLRVAEDAYLLLGMEALAAVANELAAAKCRTQLGGLAELLPPERLWDFALWMEAMNPAERERLRKVIAARDLYGGGYKQRLAENHDWIRQADVRGIELGPWFSAEPCRMEIDGRAMETSLASDLRHIFLMGAYFGTCLSLGDCNQMSVLTNAYDANKQVVFMFAADETGRQHIVARQLIAISSDFKLVGYCCYVSSRGTETGFRQRVTAAMSAYCGRLAAQCGLELADQGSPQEIRDHFWYDDGECVWPAEARTAWADARQASSAATSLSC
ncbi:MAG: hypothetical protein AB7O62_14215, partial [Pirellulales bacterium]